MDNSVYMMGEHAVSCADFSVRAEVGEASDSTHLPLTARVNLTAQGPSDDGCVNLRANGRVAARVGQSSIDVLSEGVVVDAGDLGNIGLRSGTAPAMQFVDLEGNGGNIVLGNGQLPVSPKIEITPDSIELSVGPNKITIGPTGVSISGVEVSVDGEATASVSAPAVTINGQLEAALKGAMATVEGSGTAAVKGAMVMIN